MLSTGRSCSTTALLHWLGAGLGKGSNLASYFESGERSFALAETESARILLEGGAIGILFIFLKLAVIVVGMWAAWRGSQRAKDARSQEP